LHGKPGQGIPAQRGKSHSRLASHFGHIYRHLRHISHLDILEKFTNFFHRYKHLQLDEVIIVCATLAFVMMIFSMRRAHELQQDIVAREAR
jgi:hypothetical protein